VGPARVPVVIVGGGPVGLSMALLLESFGVGCVLVERHERTTEHPKARGIYQRSMELFRKLGIEERVRARGLPDGADYLLYCESIAGREIGRTQPQHPRPELTPSWKCMVAQDVVEEELFAATRGCRHAHIYFSTTCEAVEEVEGGVRVSARSIRSGEVLEWFAQYVVAADGAASATRDRAGISMVGPSRLATRVNVFWRADLSRYERTRSCFAFQIVPRDRQLPVSSVLNTNATDLWLSGLPMPAGHQNQELPWSEADVVEIVRGQVGDQDLGVQPLGFAPWQLSAQVAERFRSGRIFLVGDAAHRIVPVGGFGLNTGFQGSLNLAWKLAYVVKGLASEMLLDTYEFEHRPLAQSNADWSAANQTQMAPTVEAMRSGEPDRIAFWLAELERIYHSAGRSLGFNYEIGALIPDNTQPESFSTAVYVPTDRPGARFPHLWLDDEKNESTLDWFNQNLSLVAGPLGSEWLEAGAVVSSKLGVSLDLHQLPSAPVSAGFHMGDRGAVLVRPDGHVAWRVPWLPESPGDHLASAMSTLLGR
jgi:2-polyprenyl-6-methoxyphenol hydroxylase-like FAD-dependent oxidoreductase